MSSGQTKMIVPRIDGNVEIIVREGHVTIRGARRVTMEVPITLKYEDNPQFPADSVDGCDVVYLVDTMLTCGYLEVVAGVDKGNFNKTCYDAARLIVKPWPKCLRVEACGKDKVYAELQTLTFHQLVIDKANQRSTDFQRM